MRPDTPEPVESVESGDPPTRQRPLDAGAHRSGRTRSASVSLSDALRDRALVATLLLALAVRVALVWRTNGRQVNGPGRLYGDSIGYDAVALGLFDGDYFSYPARVPGYSVFLALLHVLTSHDYDWMLYLQAGLGAATLLPTYMLGRELFSRRVGRLAALGVALHWGLANESTIFFSEAFYTPILLWVVLVLLRLVKRPTARGAVAAGSLMGVATLIRPTTVVFPLAVLAIFVVVVGMRRALRVTVAFAVGMALLLVPWSVRNAVVHDTFSLSSSVAVLYYGSPLGYDWFVADGRDFWGNEEGTGVWDVELNPARNGGHDPHLIDGDRHLTRLGVDAIEERGATYAWYSLIKAGWLWAGGPFDWYDGGYFDLGDLGGIWPRWEATWILVSRLAFVPAVAAAVVLRRSWRPLLPVYAVLAYFTVFHGLTWAEVRYSDPLVPLLLILVAAGAERLLALRTRASTPIGAGVARPDAS